MDSRSVGAQADAFLGSVRHGRWWSCGAAGGGTRRRPASCFGVEAGDDAGCSVGDPKHRVVRLVDLTYRQVASEPVSSGCVQCDGRVGRGQATATRSGAQLCRADRDLREDAQPEDAGCFLSSPRDRVRHGCAHVDPATVYQARGSLRGAPGRGRRRPPPSSSREITDCVVPMRSARARWLSSGTVRQRAKDSITA